MLCICKNIPKELENDNYEVGKVYRVCDGENGWKFVHGVQMIGHLYKDNFVDFLPVVLKAFKKLNLIKADGSAISKSEFKERASIHLYGKQSKGLKILHYYTHPKELIVSFYPMCGTNPQVLKECYQMYLDTLDGELEHFDCNDIRIGNSGIPIGYGHVYFRFSTILDLEL